MEFKILGNTQNVQQQNEILFIRTAEAEVHISIYSPSIIRVKVTRQSADTDTSLAVIQEPLSDFQFQERNNYHFHIEISLVHLDFRQFL